MFKLCRRAGIVFWGIPLALLSASLPASEITFVVEISGAVPAGEAIHVTGNHDRLGNWDPRGLQLEPGPSGSWAGAATLPEGFSLEYKITRGSWETEALTDQGQVPPNSRWEVSGDATIRVTVSKWKDLDFSPLPLDQRITGTVRSHPQVPGNGIKPRDVLVWLPPSYTTELEKRYPVLYMHDGQQVFDPTTATHQVDWGVDENVTALIEQKRIREPIVVAIYNTVDRAHEYGDTELGRAYRTFLVEQLKPFVDANYRTLPDRENTAVMGSSMGGLVSFLLVWEHPEVFAAAGCLSPAFFPEVVERIRQAGSPEQPLRIYLDNGGKGLEPRLQAGCDAMLPILNASQNVEVLWFRDPDAEHSEAAWATRVWRPLTWFFSSP